MENLIGFKEWPKIGRLNRDIVITEKIDGTNAAIGIVLTGWTQTTDNDARPVFKVYAQSRTRIITPEDDNFGFARWVEQHKEILIQTLGEGLHFGEWWGCGIQRGYDLSERRFSLFNTAKWETQVPGKQALDAARARGVAIYTVPVLYTGPWTGTLGYKDAATGEWLDLSEQLDSTRRITTGAASIIDSEALKVSGPINPRPRFAPNFILEWLKRVGSQAAPGFMKPEGICVFHKASGTIFKATVEKDGEHKGVR